jgi:hypothetical protein
MKNSNDTIGNRTHDVPACSSVPQPTAIPRFLDKNVMRRRLPGTARSSLLLKSWLKIGKVLRSGQGSVLGALNGAEKLSIWSEMSVSRAGLRRRDFDNVWRAAFGRIMQRCVSSVQCNWIMVPAGVGLKNTTENIHRVGRSRDLPDAPSLPDYGTRHFYTKLPDIRNGIAFWRFTEFPCASF